MINTKPYVDTLNGKPVAVFGLGLSGLSSAKALIAGGADVMAWDDDEEKRLEAAQAGVQLSNFEDSDLKEYAALVLAPGIPLYFPAPHPMAQKAKDADIPILCDIEILHRTHHGRKTIGITGTNGKSTTTALITHILKAAKIDAIEGGNIGVPVLDLKLPAQDGVIVLELSSYQLDLCPTYRPNISVLLNITPDHLDRHGTMENYAASKERIFEGDGIAVCGVDDAPSQAAYDRIVKSNFRKAIPISVKKPVTGGIYAKDGILFDDTVEIGNIANILTLPGLHNQQNICAAYAVCQSLGVSPEDIVAHIKTYPGLPHRQVLVRVINGIAYVNDSKATNAEAASKAISCYNNIYLIAGGQPKEGGLKDLEPFIDRIRHVFLIGESTEEFARWCKAVGLPHTKSQSLDIAVLEAHHAAQNDRGQPGGAGTVLLAPACASWDQFRSYAHRGDVFTDLVQSLSEDVTP